MEEKAGAFSIAQAVEQYAPPLVPLREFVMKVHQRCNLQCPGCYVYEKDDQTWREKPPTMSDAVFSHATRRIAEHAAQYALTDVDIIFHGGEPLLVGADKLAQMAESMRRTIPATTTFSLQTNGTLLNERALTRLKAAGIGIGVSLDGAPEDHDRARPYANGHGSFKPMAAGLGLLASKQFESMYNGLLCTIDIRNDPLETYRTLMAFDPPVIDFLLPLANWQNRPFVPGGNDSDTPYADWLIPVFDEWVRDGRSARTGVRFFDGIIRGLHGRSSNTEALGLTPSTLAVIESDGTIEQVDTLKSAYEGAAATGMNVADNSFDEVLRHPGMVLRQLGTQALSATCQRCPLVQVCGGGYYPHRYNPDNGFLNPSVYCDDLKMIIGHIRKTIQVK